MIWLVANVHISGASVAEHAIHFLDPAGLFIGLNGVILLAYVIAIPANEIVIPTVLMLTVLVTGMQAVGAGDGVMFQMQSNADMVSLLHAGGWTLLTAVNLMLFSLLHNPVQYHDFHHLQGNGQQEVGRGVRRTAIGHRLHRYLRHSPGMATGGLTA